MKGDRRGNFIIPAWKRRREGTGIQRGREGEEWKKDTGGRMGRWGKEVGERTFAGHRGTGRSDGRRKAVETKAGDESSPCTICLVWRW